MAMSRMCQGAEADLGAGRIGRLFRYMRDMQSGTKNLQRNVYCDLQLALHSL